MPPLGNPQFANLHPSPPQPCRLTLVPRWFDAMSAAAKRPRQACIPLLHSLHLPLIPVKVCPVSTGTTSNLHMVYNALMCEYRHLPRGDRYNSNWCVDSRNTTSTLVITTTRSSYTSYQGSRCCQEEVGSKYRNLVLVLWINRISEPIYVSIPPLERVLSPTHFDWKRQELTSLLFFQGNITEIYCNACYPSPCNLNRSGCRIWLSIYDQKWNLTVAIPSSICVIVVYLPRDSLLGGSCPDTPLHSLKAMCELLTKSWVDKGIRIILELGLVCIGISRSLIKTLFGLNHFKIPWEWNTLKKKLYESDLQKRDTKNIAITTPPQDLIEVTMCDVVIDSDIPGRVGHQDRPCSPDIP
ncbi:hypothetical protein J6590_022852 [Homalodisca vitripennis]|nr:hypothetical protein J6590_022852 [Homalodisca vitripennis]